VGIITLGLSYFAFQHFDHERVAALNDRILSQERLLIDYRTKLRGLLRKRLRLRLKNSPAHWLRRKRV